MTIRHMVLFTLHGEVSRDDPRALEAVAASGRLAGSVPGGEDWRIGADVSGRDIAADYAGVGDFADLQALQGFLAHPEHLAAAGRWSAIASWTIADLEV